MTPRRNYKFCMRGSRKHDGVLDRLDFGNSLAFAQSSEQSGRSLDL